MARQALYDRAETLDKALNLFWKKGYNATSIKDLEKALDMRPGSIYGAFGSKEGLFAEALALYARLSMEAFSASMAQAATPLAGLAAHVRGLACPPSAPPPSRACLLVKTVLETPDDDPVLRPAAEAFMRDMEAAFRAAYREAQASGELAGEADPERLARRLQSEIFGFLAYAQRTDAEDRIAALAEDIAADIEALSRKAGV